MQWESSLPQSRRYKRYRTSAAFAFVHDALRNDARINGDKGTTSGLEFHLILFLSISLVQSNETERGVPQRPSSWILRRA